jgi:hypothetical protein
MGTYTHSKPCSWACSPSCPRRSGAALVHRMRACRAASALAQYRLRHRCPIEDPPRRLARALRRIAHRHHLMAVMVPASRELLVHVLPMQQEGRGLWATASCGLPWACGTTSCGLPSACASDTTVPLCDSLGGHAASRGGMSVSNFSMLFLCPPYSSCGTLRATAIPFVRYSY